MVLRLIVESPVCTMLHFSVKYDIRGCLSGSGPPSYFSALQHSGPPGSLFSLWRPSGFAPSPNPDSEDALQWDGSSSNRPFKTFLSFIALLWSHYGFFSSKVSWAGEGQRESFPSRLQGVREEPNAGSQTVRSWSGVWHLIYWVPQRSLSISSSQRVGEKRN